MKTTFILVIIASLSLCACQHRIDFDDNLAVQTTKNPAGKPINDKYNWRVMPLNSKNLTGDWRLLGGQKDKQELTLPIKNNGYVVSFSHDGFGGHRLSMPNDCNQMSLAFELTKTGISPDFQQVMTTLAKCEPKFDDENHLENVVHDAIFYGDYELYSAGAMRLLKIHRHASTLTFMANDK